jgi:hypothetical protein
MYDMPPRVFDLSTLSASPTISMEQWLLARQTDSNNLDQTTHKLCNTQGEVLG